MTSPPTTGTGFGDTVGYLVLTSLVYLVGLGLVLGGTRVRIRRERTREAVVVS